MSFAPLPRRDGLISYRTAAGADWGYERWGMTSGADGMRVLTAHCEMAFGADAVVRDSVLSVHGDYQPYDAYVRIMNHGEVTGTGWFTFSENEGACESLTKEQGRLSQRIAISRPFRGLGLHSVQSDGWLAAMFPFDRGAGHVQYWGQNLMHSLHHLGATGPFFATTRSGLEYLGTEIVEVPAGRFDCHRIAFRGITNDHPPYDMWLTRDGDFLYVKGTVGGYMESVFELVELSGAPLA